MSDQYTDSAVYEQDIDLSLSEMFTETNVRIQVNVTEKYNAMPEVIDLPDEETLVVIVRIYGLSDDTLMVGVALGVSEIEDVTMTPRQIAQEVYETAVDALKRRGQQDSE